jgi:hypothetical protein
MATGKTRTAVQQLKKIVNDNGPEAVHISGVRTRAQLQILCALAGVEVEEIERLSKREEERDAKKATLREVK